MLDPVSIAVLTLAFTALCLSFISLRRSSMLPPGPPGKIIFGNLGQLKAQSGRESYRKIAQLVDQYGIHGMATLYLGSRPVVFVKDLETIKKMAHADEYTGRPLSVRDHFFHRKGLIFTDGDEA
ncbi:hypothetical protein BV898_13688 [Hypsibius exemplaris]|uniref:Uncharacterized protein n=1 Tax=Hypsibius exemplaris TaxID=2072580 RepID=A0A1W0WA45_HYPEX|nr:hypothetical protein BV898_13688 [Hypsibius exemplaris]